VQPSGTQHSRSTPGATFRFAARDEGIADQALLSELRADAERLTDFPLDIVAMEHIHPAYADYIRRHGRLVYER